MKIGLISLFIWILPSLVYSVELQPYRGKPLPPFTLNDLEGRKHQITDYRGKVVLVNFWGTWCPPCVREFPSMQRLKTKLADKPFTILALNVGDDTEDIRKFIKKVAIDFTILIDTDSQTSRAWRVYAYPANFILDTTGRIVYAFFGPFEWDGPEALSAINALLP